MANTNFSGPVISAGGFTGDLTGAVTGNLTGLVFGGAPEVVNEDGTLSVSVLLSIVGPDGSDGSAATAFTLPDGTTGQMKLLKYQDGTVTTDAVVTPDNLEGYSTLTFDAKAEYAVLVFDGSSWIPIVSTATLG
jgi:hypothetical protein